MDSDRENNTGRLHRSAVIFERRVNLPLEPALTPEEELMTPAPGASSDALERLHDLRARQSAETTR